MIRALLALGIAAPLVVGAQEADPDTEVLEEVVVTGRQPGPPLWKISSGEHVLWILPLIDLYPRKMEWDSARVERLIAGSQEYIDRPVALRGISTSNLLTVLRVRSMARKSVQLPGRNTLIDVLPPDLYRRFSALKARYFPRNRKIEKLDITLAGKILQQEILDEENLEMLQYSRIDSPLPITSKLRKWLNANKALKRTAPVAVKSYTISSADLKAVQEVFAEASTHASIREWQLACFEKAIAYFEEDLSSVKRRANAWAQGRVDDLVSPTPLYGGSASCRDPPAVPAGIPAIEELRRKNPDLADFLTEDRTAQTALSRARWLEAAEAALARNTSTFGVLPVNDVVDEGGLVDQLRARGYAIEVSAE